MVKLFELINQLKKAKKSYIQNYKKKDFSIYDYRIHDIKRIPSTISCTIDFLRYGTETCSVISVSITTRYMTEKNSIVETKEEF